MSTMQSANRSGRADAYLRYTLDSGSARVFNCLRISADIIKRAAKAEIEPELLFKNKDLNNIVYIKEASKEDTGSSTRTNYRIKMKLYFPYDQVNIYAGGQSIFYHDNSLRDVLRNSFGIDQSINQEFVNYDLRVMGILDSLPSLDPFLVRDRMQQENVTCDDQYFSISLEEWKTIQGHIRSKIEPMVMLAMPDSKKNSRQHVDFFIDKIWRCDDVSDLLPLIQAFRLPTERTAEIFHAWKGLAYYEYQFTHNQERIRRLAEWLKDSSEPLDFVKSEQRNALKELRERIRMKIKRHWTKAATIFKQYNESYEELFVRMGSAGPFAEFMGHAPTYFWSLGDMVSRVYQGVEVWDKLTHRYPSRRLKSDSLLELFSVMDDIL